MLANLWITALVTLAVVLITFAIGVARRLHRVIDIAWGLGFSAIAVTTAVISSGALWNRLLPTALTVAWGVRLAAHIFTRSRGKGEDPRYAALLGRAAGNPNWYALRMIYLLQAVIMWFVSLPVQVVQYQKHVSVPVLVAGSVIWAVGFFFEAVGDFQLARFSRDPDSRGRVLDTGLWRYTRHPNYFGDATLWWGLWVLSLGSWSGLLTIASPALMTYFLAGKTGKPLLEKGIEQRRPGYADYVRRTSGFVPLPPRAG